MRQQKFEELLREVKAALTEAAAGRDPDNVVLRRDKAADLVWRIAEALRRE